MSSEGSAWEKHKHDIRHQSIYYQNMYIHATCAIRTCMSTQCDHVQTQLKSSQVCCLSNILFFFSGRLKSTLQPPRKMTEQGRILPRNGEHKNTCSKIKPNQTKHMQLQTQWIRKCAGTFFLGGNTGRGRVTHHGKWAMTHSFICMSSKKGMEPNHPSKNCHAFFSKKNIEAPSKTRAGPLMPYPPY